MSETLERKTLTVGVLIEDLKNCDPDSEVVACVAGCDLSVQITNMIMAHMQEDGKKLTVLVVDKNSVLNAITHAQGVSKVVS